MIYGDLIVCIFSLFASLALILKMSMMSAPNPQTKQER